MKKSYNVILTSLVDPIKAVDQDNPETKNYYFEVEADDEQQALYLAKEQHDLSVWESDVYEN